jgi:hypothetical protein
LTSFGFWNRHTKSNRHALSGVSMRTRLYAQVGLQMRPFKQTGPYSTINVGPFLLCLAKLRAVRDL